VNFRGSESLQRIDTHLDLACSTQEGGIGFVFWRNGARESFTEPQRWTFSTGLVLG